MTTSFLELYNAMRRTLGVCPCCGELFRLSDIRISYRRSAKADWLEVLDAKNARLQKREESIRTREKKLKEVQAEKGRREMPELVRKAAPIVARLGFHPQEIKSIFHPIDLIAFDGMRSEGKVQRVVMLDAETTDVERTRLQNQISKAVERGEYHWETVNVGDDGAIQLDKA